MASYSVGESVIVDGRGEGVITAEIDRGNGCREYFVMITGTDYEACLTEGRLKKKKNSKGGADAIIKGQVPSGYRRRYRKCFKWQ